MAANLYGGATLILVNGVFARVAAHKGSSVSDSAGRGDGKRICEV